MKVLHILDRSVPDLSGYSMRSKYILEFQKEAGLTPVALTSPKYSIKEEHNIDGIKYHRSHVPVNIFTSMVANIPFLREKLIMNVLRKDIYKLIRRHKIDVIHAHSPSLCGLPALSVAKHLNLPFVYEVRALWEDAAVDLGKFKENSFKYKLSKYMERKLFKKSGAIISICSGLKNEIASRIRREDIYIVPNGVDAAKFMPRHKDKALIDKYSLQDKVIVGFIGSFFNFEGLDYLISAIPKLLDKCKDAKFIIVGTGTKEKDLKKLAQQLGLDSSSVIFTGRVPHQEVLNYYSVMDILVYPRISKRITELVTPLKPLEAMAMGKVVLASNVGGLKELIRGGETGILFEAEDSEDLTKKLADLVNDKLRRERIGAEARAYVLRSRDWSRIVPQYLDIYEKVMTQRHKDTCRGERREVICCVK